MMSFRFWILLLSKLKYDSEIVEDEEYLTHYRTMLISCYVRTPRMSSCKSEMYRKNNYWDKMASPRGVLSSRNLVCIFHFRKSCRNIGYLRIFLKFNNRAPTGPPDPDAILDPGIDGNDISLVLRQLCGYFRYIIPTQHGLKGMIMWNFPLLGVWLDLLVPSCGYLPNFFI